MFDEATEGSTLLIDAIPFPAMIYDLATLRILRANDAAARLHGYSLEEFAALTLSDLSADPMSLRARIARRDSDGDFHGSYVTRTKTGSALELEAVGHDLLYQRRAARLALLRPKPETAPRVPAAGEGGALGVARRAVRFLTHHDPLTGLPNRTLFAETIGELVLEARRTGSQVAVVLLDIDDFKHINDTYGRREGDRIIRVCAHRLRRAAPAGQSVARLGGDTFGLAVGGLHGHREASSVVARIRETLAEPIQVDSLQLRLSAAFGISLAPRDGTAADVLLGNADMAMYRAKRGPRGEAAFFEPALQHAATERLKLEHELRDAIAARALGVVFQPIIDGTTRRTEAVEALVRWRRGKTVTLPSHFIPLAEETGLIVPLGEFVLDEATRTVMDLHRSGAPPVRLSVNLSRRQLSDERLPELVNAALERSGMPPTMLELEITETFLATDPVRAADLLRGLTALGMRIALDDFGIGYSALAFLRQFPVHVLKLDRSFVTDVVNNETTRAIATAIIDLARALKVRSLAEGVETAEQHALLRGLGCDAFQGFHFARPMPAEALRRHLLSEAS